MVSAYIKHFAVGDLGFFEGIYGAGVPAFGVNVGFGFLFVHELDKGVVAHFYIVFSRGLFGHQIAVGAGMRFTYMS